MRIIRSFVALGCIVATLPLAAVAWAQSAVSSEGAVLSVPEATAASSAPYAGTGGEVAGARPLSAAEFAAVLALKEVSAPIGRESVIGNDSRVKINNTSQYPYRAIALITFAAGRCTGWLIDSNTVATAGHCVAPGNGKGFFPRSSYRIAAGASGAARPYGSCTAKELWSNSNWINKGLDTFDYAAIVLNCSVGNRVGWFGFFYQGASLLNHPTMISGYPGDKPLTQWRSTDKVRVSQVQRLFYQNDTIGGQSGAPVWENRPNGPFASAIHAYGTYGGPPFNSNNHGTRITKPVFDFLIQVRNRG